MAKYQRLLRTLGKSAAFKYELIACAVNFQNTCLSRWEVRDFGGRVAPVIAEKTHMRTHTLVDFEHAALPVINARRPSLCRFSAETWSPACWKLALHLLAQHPPVSGGSLCAFLFLVCHPGRNAWHRRGDSVCDSCPDNYSVSSHFEQLTVQTDALKFALTGIYVFPEMHCTAQRELLFTLRWVRCFNFIFMK